MGSLIAPEAYQLSEHSTFVVTWIFSALPSALLQSIVAIVLVFVQAAYMNRIVIRHRLGNEITLIPGLIYVLLTGLFPDLCHLTPALIANTGILMMLSQIFRTYKSPRVADILFNIGFVIGLVAFLVPHYIYLLAIGFVGILIMRSIKLPEILQLLTGTVTSFLIIYGYRYIITDTFDIAYMDWFPTLSMDVLGIYGIQLVVTVAYVLLAIGLIVNYRAYTSKKIIQAQKKIDLLFWVLLFAGMAMFMDGGMGVGSLVLMSIPVAIFLSINLLNIKKPMMQEMIHLAILAGIFALHFLST